MHKDVIKNRIIKYLVDDLGYPRNAINEIVYRRTNFSITLHLNLLGVVKIIIVGDNRNNEHLTENLNEIRFRLAKAKATFALYMTSKKYTWFKLDKDSTLKNIQELPLNFFLSTKLSNYQEKVLEFLCNRNQQDNKFLFKLQNRLEGYLNGFWFQGDDSHFNISFWNGSDWINKTDNIFLQISSDGSMELVLSAEDSVKKAQFFKYIASIITDFKQLKRNGKQINIWTKIFYEDWQKDYLQVLEEFISRDKIIIDTFLQNELARNNDLGINFLDKEKFEQQLEIALRYQDKLLTKEKEPIIKDTASNPQIIPNLLTLKNIGHFNSIEIDLSERVTCIFGENGIGKTTILRAFLLAITGANETTMVDLFNLKLQRFLKIENEEKGAIKYAQEGSISLDYNMGEPYRNKVVLIYRKENRLVEIKDDYARDKKYFGATFDQNFYKNLIIGYSQIQGRNSRKQTNGLPSESIKEPNVKDILPLLYDEEDDRFEQLSDWLIGLEGDAQKKGEGSGERKVRDIVFEVISEITEMPISFKDVNHKDRLLWVSINNNQVVLFSLLSQGYKNLFSWVGHFIKRLAEANEYSIEFAEAPAIVLIDEIATFLHPKWQRNILNVLANKFKNARFIITTHSPLVASHLSIKSKALYIINPDGTVTREKHIYGRHLKSIFYDWMGVVPRPKAIQDKIDKLYVLIDEETGEGMKKAKALMAELALDLGDDDGDLVQAKTLIDLFEE